MVRPRKPRFVQFEPDITYFKPRGIPLMYLEEVIIPIEEFEALRLAELLDLDQKKAAKRMRISRTTFQRLLHSAHKKITDALVNGKAIRIEGGKYKIMPNGQRPGAGRGRGRQPGGFGLGPVGECVCPRCGTRAPHQRGVPCYQHKCPKCGQPMTRTR